MMRPPPTPPNWLRFKVSRNGVADWRALRSPLRRNSNRSPWKALAPDLVTILTTPPGCNPYCAGSPLVCTLRRRHYPAGFPTASEPAAAEKPAQKPQPGDPPHALAGEDKPEKDHECAVGDREIRALHSLAVGRVIREPDHDGGRWHDDQPPPCHELDKALEIGDVEPHPENLPESVRHGTSIIES